MKDYWIWTVKVKNKKTKIKTFMDSKANPCHKAVAFARKNIKGDRFYLDSDGYIVRHRIDIVGTYSVKSFRQPPTKEEV